MSRYNFFYDESEHSRKIGLKTITAENYYDNFVSVLIGWEDEHQGKIEKAYIGFEEKYKDRKKKGELKSTTIKPEQLKYGFASLNAENVDFLSDFLSLLSNDVLIYCSSISKIEYLVSQLTCNYESNFIFDKDLLTYALVKVLVTNKPKEVQKAIYVSPEAFIKELRSFLQKKIEIDKQNVEVKELEISAFEEILAILQNVQTPEIVDWDYTFPFTGFKKFLSEKDISDYNIIIDREGDKQNTVNAAKYVGLKNVSDALSNDQVGIRMADMLCGLIAKMMKSLTQALHSKETYKITQTLLPEEWFKVNESQFALYKKFAALVDRQKDLLLRISTSVYGEDVLSLIVLFEYFDRFSRLEELSADASHSEKLNDIMCNNLRWYFDNLRNKLPPYHIPESQVKKGYFFNPSGAKCFFDPNKQPILPLVEGENKYMVLSVGLNAKILPIVTVRINSSAYCFRLPKELGDWAFSAVVMANSGMQLFPAEVSFTKEGDQVFAVIL